MGLQAGRNDLGERERGGDDAVLVKGRRRSRGWRLEVEVRGSVKRPL